MLDREKFDKIMFVVRIKRPKTLKWAFDLTYEKYSLMNEVIQKREERNEGVCCLENPNHQIVKKYRAWVTEDLDSGKQLDTEFDDGGEPSYRCDSCNKDSTIDLWQFEALEETVEEEVESY